MNEYATPNPKFAIDADGLEQRLKDQMRGEVRFDNTSRALYATDASNYRQTPIGVVIPRDEEDVITAMAACHDFKAPVLPRGAGTSLCGQTCNVAVVFDFSKYMNRIIEIDPAAKAALVQPGVILDDLRAAAEKHHLTFAPDPSTHNHNTLGGMIGNNSCGPHSVMGGRTSDNIIDLDILTYDGHRFTVGDTDWDTLQAALSEGGRRAEIYRSLLELGRTFAKEIRERYPDIPRRVSGYNLTDLLDENNFNVARALVGSEGTCCMVLNARVQLVDSPPERVLLAIGYENVFAAADRIPTVMDAGPIAVEGIDDKLVEDMKLLGLHPKNIEMLPDGGGWLLVEFGGNTREEATQKAKNLMEELRRNDNSPSMKLFTKEEREQKIWTVRKSGLGATAHVPQSDITWEGWEDSAVPPKNLGDYLRGLRELFNRFGYEGDLYGHFGQGCVHTRINFDLETKAGIEKYKRFMDEATDLVLKHGGSLSGEHGDGQSKAQFLGKMYGRKLIRAFQEFKSIWDPDWKMNPGKVVSPYRIDQNLRLGTDYNPMVPETHFKYPQDKGDFPRAVLRCVGVGECRKHDTGTMCPSYMATMEEMHSTRGRARLLFEMLQGDVVKDGWRDEGVKESLDLCLSCKGCLKECPVDVDMATYKAEFMAHYYEGKLHPRTDYAYGLIFRWLKLGSMIPRTANFFSGTRPFANWLKSAAGMAHERQIPKLAKQSFTRWFFSRKSKSEKKDRQVLLWPDTFNNYLHPNSAKAAVAVLEAAGFDVIVPRASLCCGRPLYEFGMLKLAKKKLEQVMKQLDQPLRDGVPIVVLEPSCASVFRNEAKNLLPFHEHTRRLQTQTYLLSEFLTEHAPDFKVPALHRNALVHGHCHHKAVMGMDAEMETLNNMKLECELLDSGCCGMAGSFGFEKEKYEVSMKIGERVLLPKVREADADTLIIADGFSCREQIAQCTDRKTLHLAEVIYMALEQQSATSKESSP